jgi:hypothetical protein
MYKNSITHHITKVVVDIMFFGGIAIVIAVPWLARLLSNYYGYTDTDYWILTIALFTSGVCAVYILFNLKVMFKTLLGGNPFVEKNISCLRKIAVASMLIAIIFAVKTILMFTVATAVIVLVFIIASLFCLTLKDIFKQAIYYKEEHDWTV